MHSIYKRGKWKATNINTKLLPNWQVYNKVTVFTISSSNITMDGQNKHRPVLIPLEPLFAKKARSRIKGGEKKN